MEAVDELEAEGDQQGHAEQQEGRPGGDRGTDVIDVLHQAVGAEQQSGGEHGEEYEGGEAAGTLLEMGLARVAGGTGDGVGGKDIGGHGAGPRWG